ncbi:MAG: Gfo/Idh/MocA family oxidoreductase [Petrimonas sp.]|jgi:predicted dehydrogenase|nr:Gfo/Idh/MocA family oxidoreductase [Dysgonamonadaceae bacterium]MEA4995078.1 Gfo/Idh/MocA family oxidoreductase [Petrimonas sp.]MEA5080424.1 Gfo/Idh/MocA family oxidoreductase [Dysgonamonadaceae bacterium]
MQNRRFFLKNMALGAAALYGSQTFSMPKFNIKQSGKKTENNKVVNIALIGKGGMGTSNTNTALSIEGVKLIAVCDLFDRRLNEAKSEWGNNLFLTKNYKEILDLKNVDAIIIATPDHWHQKIAIDAMNAGKHVYCEKPVIHKLKEGKALINAQKKSGIVFQVGSQGMASLGNRAARLLVQNGLIGKINFINGQFTAAPGSLNSFIAPEDATEKTIWWDQFLGNAPKRPFDAQRFLAWRNWKDYSTGIAGDLYVHVLSSVHYIMDAIGPDKVYTTGGIHYYKDGLRDTPDIMLGYFDYPDRNNLGAFKIQLGANYVDGISKKWGSTDFDIIGSMGSLNVKWNQVTLKTTYDIDIKKLEVLKQLGQGMDQPIKVSPNEFLFNAENGYRGCHYDHHFNFINGIRNNVPVIADALFAVRTAAPALLSYESYLRNNAILWDAENLREKR